MLEAAGHRLLACYLCVTFEPPLVAGQLRDGYSLLEMARKKWSSLPQLLAGGREEGRRRLSVTQS